jgi:hypothetical protein
MAQSFMEKRVDPKWVVNMTGASGMWGGTLWFLGFLFVLLGIIADATDGTLGLTMTAWFMLAIVVHLAGLSFWVSWALGVYLKAKS